VSSPSATIEVVDANSSPRSDSLPDLTSSMIAVDWIPSLTTSKNQSKTKAEISNSMKSASTTNSNQVNSGSCYYHELFLRGRADLCFAIQRCGLKANRLRQTMDPDSEPNFLAYPIIPYHAKPPPLSTAAGIPIENKTSIKKHGPSSKVSTSKRMNASNPTKKRLKSIPQNTRNRNSPLESNVYALNLEQSVSSFLADQQQSEQKQETMPSLYTAENITTTTSSKPFSSSTPCTTSHTSRDHDDLLPPSYVAAFETPRTSGSRNRTNSESTSSVIHPVENSAELKKEETENEK
jgi:hypothetical protein